MGVNNFYPYFFILIYGTKENPLFLAKDVAEWIDYDVKNTYRLLNQVEEEEKSLQRLHTLGGTQEMWFLTEEGLYEVLMLNSIN